MFDIQAELKKLPASPGVYIMKDADEQIIYVGKAKVLKNRVRQYFQNSSNHSVKVKSMVSHIESFEYIVTSSEVEALILENSLIKQHSPKYNIMLKDDKTYPYIKVTVNEPFPRVFMTRRHLKDKAKYFGPFSSSYNVKESIELINRIWPIRRCLKRFPADFGKSRPCLNHHIGQCLAPCTGKVNEIEYNAMISEILDFLGGNTEKIKKSLTEKMYAASENMEYERAAELRDLIEAVKKLGEKQIIESMSGGGEDKDVIGIARGENGCVVQIFFVRGGKICGREHFMPENTEAMEDSEIVNDFVKQFYSGTPFIPKEILLPCDISEFEIISEWLTQEKGQRVSLLIPQKGEKRKLVEMAENNAAVTLEKFGEHILREKARTVGALAELQTAMGLNHSLERIESYDISNTQGFMSVGSMVVFEQGRPKRSDYRKFQIKSVIGANDYASMDEVITRRFTRYINETTDENTKSAGFDKLPDMIFLDGGKGQISVVCEALERLGINVPVCGMVKDDRHRTRGLLYNGKEVFLPLNSEGFKLITRIQDEVHRFAIEYHRKLREKAQIHSILDDIKGIGVKRRKALMSYFGDIEAIKRAELDELKKADGMDSRSAEAVYKFFH
jgi:excinuclease ABC subunit C